MVKLIIGRKGTGKTKQLLDKVNEVAGTDNGHIVFINSGKRHIFDIDHSVRLVDTSPFDIKSYGEFYGFICGLISNDYDISNIFIDSITKIVQEAGETEAFQEFLKSLDTLSDEFNIDFTLTMSVATEDAPEFVKSYV